MEYVVQQIINALSVGSEYALLALGLAIVFSIVGLVNFAHGELITLAGYAMFFAATTLFVSPWAAIPVGIAAAVLAAIVFEKVAFRYIRNASTNTGILTAFGVSIVVQNMIVIFIATRPKPVETPGWMATMIEAGTYKLPLLQVMETLVTAAAIAGLLVILKKTTVGMAMRAAAKDFMAVRLMGIKADWVIQSSFIISGALAGLAAVFIISRRGAVDPFMGSVPVLKAFVACVLGGFGSLEGAVLGGLVLGVLEVMLQAFLPESVTAFRDAIVFTLVAAVLVAYPNGLLGRKVELGDKEA